MEILPHTPLGITLGISFKQKLKWIHLHSQIPSVSCYVSQTCRSKTYKERIPFVHAIYLPYVTIYFTTLETLK